LARRDWQSVSRLEDHASKHLLPVRAILCESNMIRTLKCWDFRDSQSQSMHEIAA
jgi:hypothetical protein